MFWPAAALASEPSVQVFCASATLVAPTLAQLVDQKASVSRDGRSSTSSPHSSSKDRAVMVFTPSPDIGASGAATIKVPARRRIVTAARAGRVALVGAPSGRRREP